MRNKTKHIAGQKSWHFTATPPNYKQSVAYSMNWFVSTAVDNTPVAQLKVLEFIYLPPSE